MYQGSGCGNICDMGMPHLGVARDVLMVLWCLSGFRAFQRTGPAFQHTGIAAAN